MGERTNIYALYDSEGETRYIGKTISSLQQRLYNHISTAKNNDTSEKAKWIREELEHKRQITIGLIEVVDGDGVNEERALIQKLWAKGTPLVNSVYGGEGQGKQHGGRQEDDSGDSKKKMAVTVWLGKDVVKMLDIKSGQIERSRSWMMNLLLKEKLGIIDEEGGG